MQEEIAQLKQQNKELYLSKEILEQESKSRKNLLDQYHHIAEQ